MEEKTFYYDINGNPITEEEWANFTLGERFLYSTTFQCPTGLATASTVHLGLDHSFGSGPPLIFETIVFCSCDDEPTWRYTTKEQARLGHLNAIDEHGTAKHYFLGKKWELAHDTF